MQMLAQCPNNIGFEKGIFDGWMCTYGEISYNGDITITDTGILDIRHYITQKTNPQGLDYYGHFPVTCPNGGSHSLKLGNNQPGSEVERISYTFIVPPGNNDYSIVYNYAVVFQDPSHIPTHQPRFSAKVYDVAADQYIDCSSFDILAAADIPGFIRSDVFASLPPNATAGTTPDKNIYYKPWSSATIKLTGYAGKTIRLEFTTNDCTQGGHFGYAYVDVSDNNCSSAITGNLQCINSTSNLLTAPLGYKEYTWYNETLSTVLGTGTTLSLTPLPLPGTVYAVVLKPYQASSLTCADTVYTTIKSSNKPFTFNVIDSAKFCLPSVGDLTASWITAGSDPGLTYSYYTDLSQTNFIPIPGSISTSGIYYIRAIANNGCMGVKPVNVLVSDLPNFMVTDPPVLKYPMKANITGSPILSGNLQGLSFTYWKDPSTTIPLADPTAIKLTGTYYIKATNIGSCSVVKPVNIIITIAQPPNIFSPNGDGIHDRWEIQGLKEHSDCSVNIFTRYGQLIFSSVGYSKPWDGTINNKKVQSGTYYYVIKFANQLPVVSGYVDVVY